MTLVILGEIGQLGLELARRTDPAETVILGREVAEFTDPESCAALVRDSGASAVINTVAYTAVDQAEREEALAATINATTPGAIARACAEIGVPLVHVSTDYVFDGSGSAPFPPEAPPGPLGAYGRTKLAGEEAVRAAGGVHAIIRTSWVVSAHGANFVKTMLRLGAERDRLTIVADQVGGPTPAADIAQACLEIAGQLIADWAQLCRDTPHVWDQALLTLAWYRTARDNALASLWLNDGIFRFPRPWVRDLRDQLLYYPFKRKIRPYVSQKQASRELKTFMDASKRDTTELGSDDICPAFRTALQSGRFDLADSLDAMFSRAPSENA